MQVFRTLGTPLCARRLRVYRSFMEQHTEQQQEQRGPQRTVGRPFLPGQSGNPAGELRIAEKALVGAKIEELASEFGGLARLTRAIEF